MFGFVGLSVSMTRKEKNRHFIFPDNASKKISMSMKRIIRYTALALATSLFAGGIASAQNAANGMPMGTRAAPVSPAALARAQQKFSAAMEIADHFSAEANAKGLDSGWRMR